MDMTYDTQRNPFDLVKEWDTRPDLKSAISPATEYSTNFGLFVSTVVFELTLRATHEVIDRLP